MEITTEVATSSANEPIIFKANEVIEMERLEAAQIMKEVLVPNNEESKVVEGHGAEGKPDEVVEKTRSTATYVDANTSDIEMVADTIIGESSSLENPSSAPSKPEIEAREEIVMSTSKISMMSSESVDKVLPTQVDASMQTEVVMEAPSVQVLKDKLHSIIDDLGTVALSRGEMNELEDMFMDAKQLLYGAGQRGRAGS